MNSLLFALPLLNPGASLPAPPTSVIPMEEDEAARNVALDVEILRRLLVKAVVDTSPAGSEVEVSGSFPNTLSTNLDRTSWSYNFLTTTGGSAHSVGHSQGFHMPGLGAVFSLEVTLPVVEVEPPREKDLDDQQSYDAWREMEQEVRGGKPTTTGYSSLLFAVRDANEKHYAIDEKAIEVVRDAVITTVARHGKRIEALARDETIVVALRITPGQTPVRYRKSDDDDETRVSWLTGYAALSAKPVHLVVRLPRIEQEEDVQSARRRAAVHQY